MSESEPQKPLLPSHLFILRDRLLFKQSCLGSRTQIGSDPPQPQNTLNKNAMAGIQI